MFPIDPQATWKVLLKQASSGTTIRIVATHSKSLSGQILKDPILLPFDVIYEDNHLLAVNKPPGLPSQPDASGDPSLDQAAKDYLRHKYNKPGQVYLGLVHRLDRPTSGVVVTARTDKAAGRMAELLRKRDVTKLYFAVVDCFAKPDNVATLRDVLSPLPNGGMRVSSDGLRDQTARGRRNDRQGRNAELSYRLLSLSHDGKRALLLVNLRTGVKHQIRCQLAARGLPVTGDFRYGPFARPARPEAVNGGRGILLHAARMTFVHPVKKEPLSLSAPPPEFWSVFASGLSGWRAEARWESQTK